MPGMLFPWLLETGLMRAPVPQNKTRFSAPDASRGRISPHSTAAEHPQPEAPAWASCSEEKSRQPQSR